MREPNWQRSLRRHHHHHCPCDGDGSVVVHMRVYLWLVLGTVMVQLRPNERIKIVETQLHVNETVTVSLQAVDVYGNIVSDAVLTGTAFSNSDDTVATVTPNTTDPNMALVDPVTTAAGKSTTLSISTQIGTANFTAEVLFDVVAGPVAGITPVLTFNPRTPPPPPPPPAP